MHKVHDLAQLTLRDYLTSLGSDEPAPGGGSAAALTGALGSALAEMVSRINAGRKKNARAPKESLEHAKGLEAIREKLLDLVTEDAQVFQKVSELWKSKSEGLEPALRGAAQVPLEVCRLTREALRFALAEAALTSSHLMSDLSEAGIMLQGSFESGALNVEINLRAMNTDKAFIQETRGTLELWRKDVERTARELIGSFWKKSS